MKSSAGACSSMLHMSRFSYTVLILFAVIFLQLKLWSRLNNDIDNNMCPDCRSRADSIIKTDIPYSHNQSTVYLFEKQKKWDSFEGRVHWLSLQWEKEVERVMQINTEEQTGITIIVIANAGHTEFTLNWIASVLLQGYKKFVVFCIDMVLYRTLVEFGLEDHAVYAPISWTKYQIPPEEHYWFGRHYGHLTAVKINIQVELIRRDYWILFSDVDVVFLHPKIPQHLKFIMGESCRTSRSDDPTCFTDFLYMIDQDTDVNTGFFLARPTPTILFAMNETVNLLVSRRENIDQLAFNWIIRTKLRIKYSKAFRALDRYQYPNGRTFFRSKSFKSYGIQAMVVHANYYVGMEKKKQAFQSKNLWYLES